MPLTRPQTTTTLPKAAALTTRSFTTSPHALPFSHHLHPSPSFASSTSTTTTTSSTSSPTRKIAAAGAAAGILLCGVGAASRAGARAVGRRGVASLEGHQGKGAERGLGVGAGVAVAHESRRRLGEAAAERQEWAIRQGTDVFW